jgi:hypothetical protein
MTQAQYFGSGEVAPADYHHYGLASPIYTHFTSPIRRCAVWLFGHPLLQQQNALCTHGSKRAPAVLVYEPLSSADVASCTSSAAQLYTACCAGLTAFLQACVRAAAVVLLLQYSALTAADAVLC